jgi:hypothetical protein
MEISATLTRAAGGEPSFRNTDYLVGVRAALGAWTHHMPGAVRATLMFFFMLFILRVLLRNQWLAAAGFVAVWTVYQTLGTARPFIDIPEVMAIYVIAALALVRFGLVALAVAVFVADSVGNPPLSLNPSIWYFGNSMFAVVAAVVLAAWAFHAATAGRRLFSADLFE